MLTNSTVANAAHTASTLTPRPTRTRPKLGHLLYGSAFLWGGASAVVAGVTTLGPSASMAIGLVIAGVGTIATVARGRQFADPTPTPVQAATFQATSAQESVSSEATTEMESSEATEEDESEFSWESPYTD